MGRTNTIAERAVMLSASSPYYKAFRIGQNQVSAFQLIWHDATSAFAAQVYSSLLDNPDVPATGVAAPNLTQWYSEAASLAIPTVAAGAAGSVVRHVGNCGAKWLLIRIAPAANSVISLLTHANE